MIDIRNVTIQIHSQSPHILPARQTRPKYPSFFIFCYSFYHESKIAKTFIEVNAAAATEPYFFVRCHASFIVNCKHITAVKKGIVTLDNSIDIPVSRNKQKETEAAYMNYLRNIVQTI